jgi:hypothetical protein
MNRKYDKVRILCEVEEEKEKNVFTKTDTVSMKRSSGGCIH